MVLQACRKDWPDVFFERASSAEERLRRVPALTVAITVPGRYLLVRPGEVGGVRDSDSDSVTERCARVESPGLE